MDDILELVRDAVITDVNAKISLEKVETSAARIRLKGLLIKNFRLGLRLNARGTKKLVNLLAKRNTESMKLTANNQISNNQNAEKANTFAQILEILKIGIFNKLDISLNMKSLRIRELSVDADQLQIAGLLVAAGAKGNNANFNSTLSSGTLRNFMEVLRRISLSRVEAHAGLDHLSARKLRLALSGTALEGFSVGFALGREDSE